MKYRFAALLVVLALIFSSFGFASATPTPAQAAADAAIAYLEEAAYAQYYHQEHTLEERTIASLPASEAQILSQVSADYATFRNAQPVLPYEEASIDTGSMEALRDNLSLHWDSVAYYSYVKQLYNITYDYFIPSYDVVSCTVDGRLAVVELYETLDFKYTLFDEPSMKMTHFYLSLMEHEGSWLVMAVESDSIFHQAYRESGFNLQAELATVTEVARRDNLVVEASTDSVSQLDNVVFMSNGLNRPYNKAAASQYALMYTTQNQDELYVTPTYKNEQFHWASASCQLFVSQCVWAGFGGSNDQTSIDNRFGMDVTGTYQWWSTGSEVNLDDPAYGSWWNCGQFKLYLDEVRSNPGESGIVSVEHTTSTSSPNDLVGTSGITASDLRGAVLHVLGGKGAFSHAVIINAATGTTRDTVRFCGYNPCAKNTLLIDEFPASATANQRVRVYIPQTLRNGYGATADYLCASPQTATVMGADGVELSLSGNSTIPVSSLTMDVYAPGASTPTYTYSTRNKYGVAATVLINQVGTWKVVIRSPGMRSYTQLIRVVSG